VDEDRDRAVRQAVVDRVQEQGGVRRPDGAGGERAGETGERAFAAAMRPFGTGAAYLNFTMETDRVRDAYGDGKYARLVALEDAYDPANLFRLNQNIRPSHTAAEPALA